MPTRRALLAAGLLLLTPLAVRAADEPATVAVHPETWPVPQRWAIAPDPALEAEVQELLERMTLEEKVGQVIQAEIQHVTPEDVRTYHLGSVLNGGGSWPGGEKTASPLDWLQLADAFWDASTDDSGGGAAIPLIWGSDAVHGHGNVRGATLFPHNVGLGAAHDPELIRRIGGVIAREVSVTGLDWTFGPCVAVARDDRWGRTYESWSEDPAIVYAYAAAMVEGIQGTPGPAMAGRAGLFEPPHVLATAKHFLADGGTTGGKDQGDARIGEAELHGVHAAGYVAAIGAGVQTVMASYSSWNGEKMHGNRDLLTGVLKERMGFDGFVVSDWNGHGQLPGCSNSSCAAALEAGIDMFMVPEDWKALWESTLAQAKSGEIPAARLDDAVRRILRVKMRSGLFREGRPSSRPLAGDLSVLGSPEHRAIARQAVRESLVLLKNDGHLLPLSPGARVLVAGDGADDVGKQAGGWTITWQGTGNTAADLPGATSIWEGIRRAVEAAGGTAMLSPDGSLDPATPAPDVAIAVYGENPYAEFEGDRATIEYQPGDKRDLELLRRLGETGVPVVSVFLSGRPLWVNPEINASDAFVAAWLPGSEGEGIADLLFRAADGSIVHDFRGRLSFSWPKRPDQTPLNAGDPGYDPLFPLGFGLTYLDRHDLGTLSEEGAAAQAADRGVFFAGDPAPPWQIANGGLGPAPTVADATRESEGDALRATWTGEALGWVTLHGEPIDLTRQSNGELMLAVDLAVAAAPTRPVALGVGCGGDCRGVVDVSGLLARQPGAWQTVRVRLKCFAEAGADMSRIDTPFALATDGALDLTFSSVRLVPLEGDGVCPPPPPAPPAG